MHAVLKLDINKERKNGSQLCFLRILIITHFEKYVEFHPLCVIYKT